MQGTEEDYVYDDGAAAEADENDAGQRLVGASKCVILNSQTYMSVLREDTHKIKFFF